MLTPFALDSWYATFLTGLLAIVAITTIQMTEYGEGWFPEMGHAVFATLGATCQQGMFIQTDPDDNISLTICLKTSDRIFP